MTHSKNNRQRCKVVIADDHPVVLAGMKTLLQGFSDIELVGEATRGDVALALIKRTIPDIVLVDIAMPGLNGLDLTRQLAQECPSVKVIALTVHEDRAYVQPFLQAGAKGYVLKRSASEDLARAVRAVADGGVYLDPAVADKAFGGRSSSTDVANSASELSPRETDVLRLTAQGFSNKEIAARLEISIKTVETYKARAADKLGLRSRAEIVRYGVSCGWLADLDEGP